MAARKHPSPTERMRGKYRISDSGCFQWKSPANKNGYGQFSLKDRNYLAHRASWILHRGEIPRGLFVLHKCDNRLCVNPDHLFLGTQRQNIHDMIKKGRRFDQTGTRSPNRSGEKHFRSRLTNAEATEIIGRLSEYRRGLALELAKEFRVSKHVIYDIKRGRCYEFLRNPRK